MQINTAGKALTFMSVLFSLFLINERANSYLIEGAFFIKLR